MDAANNHIWPESNGGDAALTGKSVAMPKDATEWVGSLTLVRMTLEAIEQVKPQFKQAQFKTTFGIYQAPMLLTLLTCAYARGLTGSREIELAIPGDRALKYICAGNRPDWNVLRLFRRQYKSLVQNCLAVLLEKVWDSQYPPEQRVQAPETGHYSTNSLDRWMLPPRPDFQAEAAKRVRLAILADTLLSDE
ncbi:MAG: hypothetical protein N3J91_08085 [Verrucomicrobiae bacterium]|nr:hypothetical protein [Verrucomicrobiae bacterium]